MSRAWRPVSAQCPMGMFFNHIFHSGWHPMPPCKHKKGSIIEQVKDTQSLYFPIPPDSRQEFLLSHLQTQSPEGPRETPLHFTCTEHPVELPALVLGSVPGLYAWLCIASQL